MSPYVVHLYHQKECLPKTAVPVIQAFSYYVSTETDLVWELIWPILHPRTIVHGCQLVFRDPLNAKTSCSDKINLFGLCGNA